MFVSAIMPCALKRTTNLLHLTNCMIFVLWPQKVLLAVAPHLHLEGALIAHLVGLIVMVMAVLGECLSPTKSAC